MLQIQIIFICICVTSMGDLLLNWLNDEIQLSRRIGNFEEDFHNGFLFGELLAKYSQQLNFHEFIDKDDKASRIKNYSLLLDTFTALKVTYDSNIAMKIINKQLGVAKKLLYELKTQLQKTNSNAFSKTNRMTKTLSPLKKIQISKQKFDSVNRQHFIKQLNEMHPAQKEIIQDQLLKRFQDFHQTTLMKVANAEEKQRQGRLLLRNKFNEQQRDNIKKSEEFRKQWEAENVEKWAVNMTVRQTQVSKDQNFKSKLQFEKSQYQTMTEMNALKALDSDIADFERRNLGKAHYDSDDDIPKEESKMVKQPSKSLDRTDPQLKVRQQVREQRRVGAAESEKRRHQREKRRRKMIVQQQKRYQMIEINRRERIIISTIQQISRQQKEIQYEIWRAWQNKDIIVENKNLYTQKIKEKEEIRQVNAKFKRDELLKIYREEHNEDVNKALSETTKLQRRHQVNNRKQTYKLCENMISELLDITEEMYVSCQERNKDAVNEKQLENALIKFVDGTKTNDQETALRLNHYINGTHEWSFPVMRPEEEVPTDPKEDNALPNEAVNNYYLGNILRNVFSKLYSPQSQQNDSLSFEQKTVISLVGLDYSRKHFLAESIKGKHNFNIIYVDKLIENKIIDYDSLKSKGVEVSKETQELVECCLNGKFITDKVIIQLIKEAIDKNDKNIIVDYPNTYEQAIGFCKVIGNVEPHDMLATDKLTKKIKQYERLVKGTESKILERRVRGCGIDFVWWIDVSTENSLDRMLGRRWIGNKEVHINDDIEPQQLKEGEKGAALVMNNHFKTKSKASIKQWFELFGTQFGSQDPISKKCWEQIEGNCDKNHLEQVIQQKINEVLSIKQKQKEWNFQLQKKLKKQEEEKAQQDKQKEELKAKCVKSNPEEIKEELSLALSKSSLNKDFLQQTAELWNKIQSSTVSSLNKVFQGLQDQQLNQRKHIAQVKRNFISLLTREDHKFHLIKDFQNNYNKFISENEDMLAYDYTKEELHQRVEDLQNCLLEVVEEKKEDAVSERNGIITSGWLQAQFDIISEAIYVLVQTQLNRYALSEKLITDYYGKRFMANTKAFQPLNAQLNLETINSQEIYKDGACSRLDKLISEALRIFNREEEVSDDKNKKGGKGAPPKKDDKKGGKKGKDEVQESKEPTAEELELKKAINTEKAILRQRLNKIKALGVSKLKSTFECVNKLYRELEDLYIYTDKVQKKAVFGLAKIFRKSIENEQKIESEVQINHVEVTQTEKIRNFEKEKPVISPARQKVSDSHFTLSNIYEIIKIVREESEGHKISTKKLIILLKKVALSHLELKKLLPQSWRSITPVQIEAFVKLLDNENRAYVDLVQLFMFIIMSGYRLPLPDEIEQYTLDLTNYSSLKQTTLDRFVSTKAWFDESIEQKENTRPFLRNKYLKEALFDVFKSGPEGHIDITAYLSALTLQDYSQIKSAQKNWTYFDFAFN